MNIRKSNRTMKKKLDNVNKELSNLYKAKKIIQTEDAEWKKHSSLNFHANILEVSELSYPWYSKLERDTLYETYSYLHPYTINFFHLDNDKKPYHVYQTLPLNKKTKTKRFKSLDKALKYIKKLKVKTEKMFKKKCNELDKVILAKEKEVAIVEKAYSLYMTTTKQTV